MLIIFSLKKTKNKILYMQNTSAALNIIIYVNTSIILKNK